MKMKYNAAIAAASIFCALIAGRCDNMENVRTVTFPDGSKYVGEMNGDLKSGYGRMAWAN